MVRTIMLQAPVKVYATDNSKDDTGEDEEYGGHGEGAEEGPSNEQPLRGVVRPASPVQQEGTNQRYVEE